MSLALRLIFAYRGWSANDGFERAALNPEKTQLDFLKQLLHREKDTAFGKEHSFANIKTYEDYRKQVPIRDYEGFRPYVDRLTEGEDAVLTRERPWMFATTSGTTDQPKLIPVNNAWRKATTNLMALWLARSQQAHPGIFKHKILTMVSPAIEGRASCGLPIGSVSGVTRRNMPWILKRSYCNPYAAMEILNYDARYRVAIRMGYANQVSLMATPNPSTLLRLAETGAVHAEQIIRAIHDGSLGFDICKEDSPHSEDQRRIANELKTLIKPRPARARELQRLIDQHGLLRPKDVWPNLAMIGCWLGGSAGIQCEKLKEWYGEVPTRDIGFRATEGTMTLPIADNTATGVPCLENGFYEFIPEDNIEQDNPSTLLAHELEQGKRYYILLTTAAGLYRYDINDIIEVQGEHLGCPMFAFARKGRDMASITGEKIHVNQVLIAAERASSNSGLRWTQIQMIPDVNSSRYDLLVEPANSDSDPLSLQKFAAALDQELSQCNDEYRQKRMSHRLHQPRVFQMREGWYQRRWRADVVTRGKRDAQYKWPVIGLQWDDETRAEVGHAAATGSLAEEDLTRLVNLPNEGFARETVTERIQDTADEEKTVVNDNNRSDEDAMITTLDGDI